MGYYTGDTLVGTDSHTTMINGLGIVGWGVGGIEAESAMLGQPVYIKTPEVIGVHLSGNLPRRGYGNGSYFKNYRVAKSRKSSG